MTSPPPLEAMSLSELVALHNQLAARPVRKFRDKATAVQRTAAVLPRPKAPLAERLFERMRDGRDHDLRDLAQALDCTPAQARNALGSLKGRGHTSYNVAPMTFRIDPAPRDRGKGPARVGPSWRSKRR